MKTDAKEAGPQTLTITGHNHKKMKRIQEELPITKDDGESNRSQSGTVGEDLKMWVHF